MALVSAASCLMTFGTFRAWMHARRVLPCSAAFLTAFRAVAVGKFGQVILDSSSVGLWLLRACGQKVQFARHLPWL